MRILDDSFYSRINLGFFFYLCVLLEQNVEEFLFNSEMAMENGNWIFRIYRINRIAGLIEFLIILFLGNLILWARSNKRIKFSLSLWRVRGVADRFFIWIWKRKMRVGSECIETVISASNTTVLPCQRYREIQT